MEISINQYKGSQIEKGFVNQINEKPSVEDIEKALENNLEKGLISAELFDKAMEELNLIKGEGEGSRGGKVIGHTPSGKPIYDVFSHQTHKNWTMDDHHNAMSQIDSISRRQTGHDAYISPREVKKKQGSTNEEHKKFNDLRNKHLEAVKAIRKKMQEDWVKNIKPAQEKEKTLKTVANSFKKIRDLKKKEDDGEDVFDKFLEPYSKIEDAIYDKKISKEQIKDLIDQHPSIRDYMSDLMDIFNHIEKALENNLEKGLIDQDLFDKAMEELDLLKAEGSRGGKVIGHTKSGKPIYEIHTIDGRQQHKDYTPQDHRDAAAKLREHSSSADREEGFNHEYAATSHERKAKEKEKKESGHQVKAKVLGKTSSGKDVYQSQKNHKDFSDWNAQDHADAAEYHIKERQKVGYQGQGAPSSAYGPHGDYAHNHIQKIKKLHPELKDVHNIHEVISKVRELKDKKD